MPVDIDSINSIIEALGKRNSTKNFIQHLVNYIMRHQNEFEVDYESTSREDRFSTGKLEKEVFLMLANICRYSNANGNAAQASDVMIRLGYYSYQHNPKRFRQKIENLKKIEKSRQSPGTSTKKTSGRKKNNDFISENEDVLEYTETESTYEGEVNYNANGLHSPYPEITESADPSLSSDNTQCQVEPEYFGDATPVGQHAGELPCINQPTDRPTTNLQRSIQLYGIPNLIGQSTEDSTIESDTQSPSNMNSIGSCNCDSSDDISDLPNPCSTGNQTDCNGVSPSLQFPPTTSIPGHSSPEISPSPVSIIIPDNSFQNERLNEQYQTGGELQHDELDLNLLPPLPSSFSSTTTPSGFSRRESPLPIMECHFGQHADDSEMNLINKHMYGDEEISSSPGNIRTSIVLLPGQQYHEELWSNSSYNTIAVPTQNNPLTSSRNNERTLTDSIHSNKGGAEIEKTKNDDSTVGFNS